MYSEKFTFKLTYLLNIKKHKKTKRQKVKSDQIIYRRYNLKTLPKQNNNFQFKTSTYVRRLFSFFSLLLFSRI